jgi:hypothetical protein
MARHIVLEKYFLETLRIEVSQLPLIRISIEECPERETMPYEYEEFVGCHQESDLVSPFLIT